MYIIAQDFKKSSKKNHLTFFYLFGILEITTRYLVIEKGEIKCLKNLLVRL